MTDETKAQQPAGQQPAAKPKENTKIVHFFWVFIFSFIMFMWIAPYALIFIEAAIFQSNGTCASFLCMSDPRLNITINAVTFAMVLVAQAWWSILFYLGADYAYKKMTRKVI